MNSIVCPKCNKLNAQSTGAADEACPHCGVIYSKARPSATRPEAGTAAQKATAQAVPAAPSRLAAKVAQAVGAEGGGRFIDRLRAESHYPAFRTVVGLFYLLGLAIGLICLAVAVVFMWNGGVAAGVGGLVFGIVVLILAKVGKEVSLMMADLTDATIRVAARDGQ